MKDVHHTTKAAGSLAPAVYTASADGEPVHLVGFKAAELIVTTGAVVGDGDFTVTVEESYTDSDEDFDAVDAADVLGSLPETLAANSVYSLGYIGKRPHVRATIAKNSGTSIAVSAVFVLSGPHLAPVA